MVSARRRRVKEEERTPRPRPRLPHLPPQARQPPAGGGGVRGCWHCGGCTRAVLAGRTAALCSPADPARLVPHPPPQDHPPRHRDLREQRRSQAASERSAAGSGWGCGRQQKGGGFSRGAIPTGTPQPHRRRPSSDQPGAARRLGLLPDTAPGQAGHAPRAGGRATPLPSLTVLAAAPPVVCPGQSSCCASPCCCGRTHPCPWLLTW